MLLIQLIGFIAFIFLFASYILNKKEDIVTSQLIAYMTYSVHYLLLGAFTGSLLELGCAASSLLAQKNIKNKKIFMICFAILYILVGIITFDSWYSLLPTLVCILTTFTLLYGNELAIRLSGIITAIGWGIYSLMVLSYAGFYSNIILLLFIVYCIITRRKK